METRAILHRGRPLDCFPTSESGMYIRLRAARGERDDGWIRLQGGAGVKEAVFALR